ncbi:UTP--glucose-1-phosphate uridylyltransferase [Acinetobacter phage AB1I1M-1]
MTNYVTKAVIPVAGLGTRLLPASKAIPKEMITIVDRPAIEYVVKEAVAAGAKEIILVTRSDKECIADHFDTNFELEHTLEQKGKFSLLNEVRETLPVGVTVTSVRQNKPLGLGHAIWCARNAVGDEAFMVLLPDVLISSNQDMKNLVNRYNEKGAPQVMVQQVPLSTVDQYGVVKCKDLVEKGNFAQIHGLVEKPPLDEAPSNLAIVGRYVLSPLIFKSLQRINVGAGGELQLTDAIVDLQRMRNIECYHMKGQSFDCGNKLGYFNAVLHYGCEHPQLGNLIKSMILEKSESIE